jgi:hydrogenase maturation protease
MKKGLIIGLGNALHKDGEFAWYVLESLSRETLSASVQFLYPGDDPRYAGGLIYDADFVVVVGTMNLGGPPGRLHAWPLSVFLQHIDWMTEDCQEVRLLVEAMSRADLAGGLPDDMWFLWVDAQGMNGCGASAQARRAVWKTTRAIKEMLIDRDFLPAKAMTVTPIYRFDSMQPAL